MIMNFLSFADIYVLLLMTHTAADFILLVGQSVGDIELWDVTSAEKLVKGEFIASEVKSTSGALLVYLFSSICFHQSLPLVSTVNNLLMQLC